MGNSDRNNGLFKLRWFGTSNSVYLIVLLIASAIYLGCIISPPFLSDDVDAVQAQIGRNMLSSGDWVTPRIDGIIYLEKPPLIYWLIAASYKLFGAHDWAARLPVACSSVALAWLITAFGIWAFGRKAGFYASLCISTCAGLFLFTRIQIPDVMQTFTITLAFWALLRVLDESERHPRLWSCILAASLGLGLLLKSLIGILFPVGGGVVYLLLTHELFRRETWRRLHPFSTVTIIVAIAAPWHVLATLRNPPYFAFSLHSVPGQYHGFVWFFFINEQLLRFLNLRYPRDYDTVPRLYFWLFNLIWLFPWSVYLPTVATLKFGTEDRASRTRLLAVCWIGFILVFFTFSTTQEYYSMPCYPAFALLLGCGMAGRSAWVKRGTRALATAATAAGIAALVLLFAVRNLPTPGDISVALTRHPDAYRLSLGHMLDLTVPSFAYLRLPLSIAALSFVFGAVANSIFSRQGAFLSSALMMLLFFHSARLAMVVFDPYMSSHPLAEALLQSPPGKLIIDHHYYKYSSVFFYTNRTALLLNGRRENLVYGSYAPGAPDVFIDDAQWRDLWSEGERCYLVASNSELARLTALIGPNRLQTVVSSGGKALVTNLPVVHHLGPAAMSVTAGKRSRKFP